MSNWPGWRAWTWPTNAHMIADVASLGYIRGWVFDATYGEGNFWTKHRPDKLTTNDLYRGADHHHDFTAFPHMDEVFDTVVFDPPYKLNGTPSEADYPYGVHVATRWQDRMELIVRGSVECARVAREYLLVKVMDQVCSGAMRWQTDEVRDAVLADPRWKKVDRFDFLNEPRPQPEGRQQRHAAANCSTLLVFGTKDAEWRRKNAGRQ